MKARHTPEPWVVLEDDDGGYSVYHPDGQPGKIFIATDITQGHDYGKSDAHLIAAAPRLLQALEKLYSDCKEHGYMPPSTAHAERAIKKAHGA